MKQILINDDDLKEEELDFSVIRVKALIVNSQQEILLAHNNGTYQFPGGHKEDNETLDDCMIREIKEETGIDIDLNVGPFMQITTFDPNYFGTEKKVCNKIYYYVVNTDDVPNFEETHYDELECQTDFDLFYVELSGLKAFLEKAIEEGSLAQDIGKEMSLVCSEYDRLYGGN